MNSVESCFGILWATTFLWEQVLKVEEIIKPSLKEEKEKLLHKVKTETTEAAIQAIKTKIKEQLEAEMQAKEEGENCCPVKKNKEIGLCLLMQFRKYSANKWRKMDASKAYLDLLMCLNFATNHDHLIIFEIENWKI